MFKNVSECDTISCGFFCVWNETSTPPYQKYSEITKTLSYPLLNNENLADYTSLAKLMLPKHDRSSLTELMALIKLVLILSTV